MAYFLFLDESGQDHHESPYEVLGGLAVEDSRIWSLITALRNAEVEFFGQRITHGELELKGKKLLKRKTFRLAGQMGPIPERDRSQLAHDALEEGRAAKTEGRRSRHTRSQLTALAQAKLAFCGKVFELCAFNQSRAFASIVLPTAYRPTGTGLRKDYAYLFERFYRYLEDLSPRDQGIVVFDELEKIQSQVLMGRMAEYFLHTSTGRLRSSRILPEPFFVHSDQATLTQVADLIVYVVSWAVRLKGMDAGVREELEPFAKAIRDLRYRAVNITQQGDFHQWSFAFISDLRPKSEREM
jgi:hypothetical protein